MTDANLNSAFLSGVATLQPTVLVQLPLPNCVWENLFSGVVGSIQSVTEAKGEWLGQARGARVQIVGETSICTAC